MTHALFRRPRTGRHSTIALALAAAFSLDANARQHMVQVEIIGTTPLPGIGQPRNQVAAPVQTANSADIERSGALELGEYMNRRLGSVHVNEMQGNPFQMDVSYRGYTASPLLGTAQGLSVYLDGVRMNQPFGDVVSWDLIPRAAIASIVLMPGSNPLFGLNTLGGALSVQTKDGASDPGTALQATVGANGRRALEFEHGGASNQGLNQGLNWYLTGNLFKERGWRDDSPSDVRQLFGKLGWQDRATDLTLTLAHADNDLTGNGLQEQGLLARNRASVYTKPDQTKNRSTLVNMVASHSVNDTVRMSGNLYYRAIRTATFNGDINENSLDQSVYQPGAAERAALAAAGYNGFPTSGATAANTPFPSWRCIGQMLLNDEPAEKCNGVINRTASIQRNYGLSGQVTWLGTLAGQRNRLVIGAGYDASRIHFTQSSQLGYLLPDRSIAGVNAVGDGVNGGAVNGQPYDTRVDLSGRIRTWSALASDTLSIDDKLHLTLSGRFNTTSIANRDRIHADGDSASLSGDHRFARFNPAAGLTYSPTRTLNAYAGYSQSSRAPTAIELGCANPEQPCKLPNAMAGDPPLRQVLTRTAEFGLRGGAAAGVQWNAAVFSARNRDDLLFVADNQAGFGYFKNFGQTRRRGLELGLNGRLAGLNLGAQYTLLDATFQSPETVNGSSNSSNDAAAAGGKGREGRIVITPGERIPLIPGQMLKLFADYTLSPAVVFQASMVSVSRSRARGNENNAHQPDGSYYLGPGYSAGYAVFNLGASVRLAQSWQLLAQINNVFDRRYNTAAQLGPTGFDANGNFVARPFADNNAAVRHSTFYAPGAPRLAWAGLRYTFGR